MTTPIQIESAGCDWLTMTWKASDPRIEQVSGTVYERLSDLQGQGHKLKERKIMQYQGVGTEKLFWGRDDTHFYLQATSWEGHETAKKLIGERVGGNATRCDLEITAPYPEREKDYFAQLRKRLGKSDLGPKSRQPEIGAEYFCLDRDTGISLGARGNERSCRFYSAREGGHPEFSENAVRFEFQYRQGRARQVWGMMESAANLSALAQSVVQGEVMALGLHEPWMNSKVAEKLPPLKVDRSIEKRFEWYEKQVFPSFLKTIEEGYGEELLQRLTGALAEREKAPRIAKELEISAYKSLFRARR